MKINLTSIIRFTCAVTTVLLLSACSAMQTGGTHEMGPPGRSETMANGFMLEQGGGSTDF